MILKSKTLFVSALLAIAVAGATYWIVGSLTNVMIGLAVLAFVVVLAQVVAYVRRPRQLPPIESGFAAETDRPFAYVSSS